LLGIVETNPGNKKAIHHVPDRVSERALFINYARGFRTPVNIGV
jgi:hypothetical protein